MDGTEPEGEQAAIEDRMHIIEGLLTMLERDDLHTRLRACETPQEAKELLTGSAFGFSEIQAAHVLDASNRRWVGSARTELEDELDELRRQAGR